MRLKILLVFTAFLFIHDSKAFSIAEIDTLLVYFSNDSKVNKLYLDYFKLKYPGINLIDIKNKDQFESIIPKDLYKNRTVKFGRSSYLSGLLNEELSDTLNPNKKDDNKIVSYYFFDISSSVYTGSYQVFNSGGETRDFKFPLYFYDA